MREQVPINPSILEWARLRSGASVSELTAKFSKYLEWEAGESSPTYNQLEAISDFLKTPIAVFFFSEPPDVPSASSSFRTLPDTEIEAIPRQVRNLLRKAQYFQLNLYELTDGKNPAEKIITQDISPNQFGTLSAICNAVREYIGVSLEEQISWTNPEAAAKLWRKHLHDVGIFIFKDAFRVDGYSGFCLYDEVFPVIFVNNTASKTRQIFTYFHELAHVLFHTSGIDKINDIYISKLSGEDKRIEVFCNKFAAEFLLPSDIFEDELSHLEEPEPFAQEIADKYGVSREVVFRKLLDRSIIDEGVYDEARERWAQQFHDAKKARKAKGAGGNPYWTKLSYLGPEYVDLAFRKFYRDNLDASELADFLDVKPKQISTFENYYERSSR